MNEMLLLVQEYARLRQNGLEVREAVQALNTHVHTLNHQQIHSLQEEIRAWEANRTEHVLTPQQHASMLQANKLHHGHKITCPVCNRLNNVTDLYCYSCGEPLSLFQGGPDTDQFINHTPGTYFDARSSLMLESEDGIRIKIRPQDYARGIILGRKTNNSNNNPDIDLTDLGAAIHGVSRQHLCIIYSERDFCLRLHDMGSANGTYLDGRRLHSSERLVLSHSNNVRLGMLGLKVCFIHPT
jgi:hypothetical protein